MTLVLLAALTIVALLAWPLPEAPRDGVRGPFLLRSVTIIDVEAGRLLPPQDVLIRDGEIAAMGSRTV